MQFNLASLKLEYAKYIKYYASLSYLSDEQVADLHNKTRVFFDLDKGTNIDTFISYWKPEEFLAKIEFEVEKIHDYFFESTEVL
jgi:hypothetical protein